jgi:hypothetical protein
MAMNILKKNRLRDYLEKQINQLPQSREGKEDISRIIDTLTDLFCGINLFTCNKDEIKKFNYKLIKKICINVLGDDPDNHLKASTIIAEREYHDFFLKDIQKSLIRTENLLEEVYPFITFFDTIYLSSAQEYLYSVLEKSFEANHVELSSILGLPINTKASYIIAKRRFVEIFYYYLIKKFSTVISINLNKMESDKLSIQDLMDLKHLINKIKEHSSAGQLLKSAMKEK